MNFTVKKLSAEYLRLACPRGVNVHQIGAIVISASHWSAKPSCSKLQREESAHADFDRRTVSDRECDKNQAVAAVKKMYQKGYEYIVYRIS